MRVRSPSNLLRLLAGAGVLAVLATCPACQRAPADSPGSAAQPSPVPSAPLLPSLRYLDRASVRFPFEKSAPLEALFEALELKSGMKVLLLGSGSGYLEFPLARAVGPQGELQSWTENSAHSSLLNHEAAGAGLSWFHSSFLEPGSGAIPSLEAGTFDRVIWFNSFNPMAVGPAFAQTLHDALKPTGVLAVFAPRLAPHFGLDSGWSKAYVAGVFRLMGPDFPVLQRLPAPLKDCLAGALAGPAAGVEVCLDDRFLGALNDLRQDSSLYFALRGFFPWVQFYSEMAQRVSHPELVQLNWLTYNLGEVVDLADEAAVQRGPEVEAINTLLLASLFSVDNPGARPDQSSYSWHADCDLACVRASLDAWFVFRDAPALFSDYDVALEGRRK